MGSRSFYEGWDSNRPNVINFVNIGTGEDARKFIIQSVGRGVRIQSWGGARKRLEELTDAFDDKAMFRRLREKAEAPETLYVLGTNREALNVVLEELKKEKPLVQDFLRLELNPESGKRLLLVPEYRDQSKPLIEERVPSKFEIAPEDFDLVSKYDDAVKDDRVLLLAHGGAPSLVKHFRDCNKDSDTYFAKQSARSYRNMEVMVGRVMDYFGLRMREVERIRELEPDDIVHFRQMSVDKVHAEEIQNRVNKVIHSQTKEAKGRVAELTNKVGQLELGLIEANRIMEDEGLTGHETYNQDLTLEYLANHYYLPTIFSNGKRLDYLRHIIDTESEVRFLGVLRDYVKKSDCVLKKLDWWMFSKLDQYLDDPFIPYYDPKQNREARFIPDFIFWGQLGKDYVIHFVDPKGMEQIDWERKVDGYCRQFENGKGALRVFGYDNLAVTVRLSLFTSDRNKCPAGSYSRFWHDNAHDLFNAAVKGMDVDRQDVAQSRNS